MLETIKNLISNFKTRENKNFLVYSILPFGCMSHKAL